MSTYKGFSRIELRKPKRSKFDLSHEKKLSTRMGRLTPILISETLPNDTFRGNTEVMLRLAPLLAPIYHRVNVFVHHFFVPIRLLYKDWEKLITNGRLGTETPPVPPYGTIEQICNTFNDALEAGSLADYLGIPPVPDADAALWANRRINLHPFAAYYKVWYDYYRDRNYVDDNEILPLASGAYMDDITDLTSIRTRCWQHDYFTSALPFTQRGNEVLMPLEGSGSVTYKPGTEIIDNATGLGAPNVDLYTESGFLTNPVGTLLLRAENIDSVQLDSSNVSINDLRTAIALQQWYERNAVAGSRYNETIEAHFNRRTSDGRLQRAEYLGGGRVNVQISEVMTTAWSVDGDANDIPPANMAGRGATYSKSNSFRYNCEEHGIVLSIMSVMPTSAYMQGIPRMFTHRDDFLDYPWPSFANLGEQEVHKSEIYMSPTNFPAHGTEKPLFGYQSRYADWKWIASTAHGDFRGNLDYWHLDRKFAASPTLGNTFVTFEDALQDRIFAVSEVDTLWCYIHNKLEVVRSLPYFGTPGLSRI